MLVVGGAAAAYFSGLADPLVAMITGKKAPEKTETADAGDKPARTRAADKGGNAEKTGQERQR